MKDSKEVSSVTETHLSNAIPHSHFIFVSELYMKGKKLSMLSQLGCAANKCSYSLVTQLNVKKGKAIL
jgi:hypothetical protein